MAKRKADPYQDFLRAKVTLDTEAGFDVKDSEINPILKPHQRAGVRWALRGGRRALFESFGLGKTIQQLEILRLALTRIEGGGRGLIVCPLGVRQEFKRDALEKLGWDMPPHFVRTNAEVEAWQRQMILDGTTFHGIYITNYESVRDGKLDPNLFDVVSLDEASCLRGFGGTKTFREFMRLFAGDGKTLNERVRTEGIKYRFVATATPSPNDYIELLAYAAFLGVMDVSAAKTRFFKRDSTKADKLTIHPHKEREFWLWVSSWALFLQSPADLGFDPAGYDMPPVSVIKHEVSVDHKTAKADKSGQQRMFRDATHGVVEAAREKRDTLPERMEAMKAILKASPNDHFLLWHDLEAERDAIEKAIPGSVSVYGTQDLDEREEAIINFSDGKIQYLAAKPVIAGSGCNFQYYCHKAIYLGIGFKFNDFIQAYHRIVRYLQDKPVEIHIIYAESERQVLKTLETKWEKHNEMVKKMSEIIREYGLSHEAMAKELTRGFGVERVEIKGENYTLINNDSVLETADMGPDSVHLILTSIPFCYDQETEVLTRRGWTNFGTLEATDEVATINPDRLCFEWQNTTRIVWERYDGEMLQFGNRCFDLLVTPNHNLFAARRGKGFSPSRLRLVEAEQIARDYESARRKNGKIGRLLRGWRMCLVPPGLGDGLWPSRINIPPLPADIRSGHGVELYWIETEEFMALAGWYLSEGHADSFSTGRLGGRISIAQVVSEKLRTEIADLFTRIGLPPSWHSRQISVWCRNLAHFLIKEFGSGSKRKHIPAWLRDFHPDLLRILRDTMMKGDGGKNLRTYTSYSTELRDNFQEICLKTGWRATIKGMQVKLGTDQIYPEIRQAPKRIRYKGMIGCATVPNGLLIVRRNGKPCISGNSTQYEYSPNFADFGHSDNNEHFFQQMDFLTPNLFRVLVPGRIAAIHVKDRIVPGGMTGLGFQTVYPFHMKVWEHYTKHGFAYIGMKTIVTDVVRENNQTYRLGWTEQCRDGTKMGVGMPEYLLLFRKPPTDTSNSYGDIPVVKSKRVYSRSRWQIDAHGFTRSSGDRLMDSREILSLPHATIFKLFRDHSLNKVYDFEQHVAIGEALETCQECQHIHVAPQGKCECGCTGQGRLPVTFMLLQPQSWQQDVWTDITRMLTLNTSQSAKGKELHLCCLQLDLANRVIAQLSMPGETILDPFGGLMTVPYCAIKQGRKGIGIELSHPYFIDGAAYCEAAEREASTPSLFDTIEDPMAELAEETA